MIYLQYLREKYKENRNDNDTWNSRELK